MIANQQADRAKSLEATLVALGLSSPQPAYRRRRWELLSRSPDMHEKLIRAAHVKRLLRQAERLRQLELRGASK